MMSPNSWRITLGAMKCWFLLTGKDATDDFENVGHSATDKAMMEEFYIGDINTSTIPSKTAYTPPKQPHYNQNKTSHLIRILQFLVPFILFGAAVSIRFYTQSLADFHRRNKSHKV